MPVITEKIIHYAQKIPITLNQNTDFAFFAYILRCSPGSVISVLGYTIYICLIVSVSLLSTIEATGL